MHNLPERNRHFSGRVKVLQDIEAALNANNGIAGITQVQGISGLGGIGKTQTALEFAWRHAGNPYTHLFWVRADSEGECFSGFTEIARKLELPQKDDQDARLVVDAVLKWFQANAQWLLILDNVEPDGQKMAYQYLPHSAPGHVLITTRAHALDRLDIPKPIPLDKMDPEEARDFLLKRTGNQNAGIDIGPVNAVANTLDYLPLALEQAAAYIVEMACTFEAYAKSYEKHRPEFLGYKTNNSNYPDSVATTWRMNFEQIEQQSKPARDLLYLCAFLDPDRIPLEILCDGAPELGPELASALAECSKDSPALNNVLWPLIRYSLIRRSEDGKSFSAHRIVQEVLRTDMSEEEQSTWAERAALGINAAFPGDYDFDKWPLCDCLLPHAQRAAEYMDRYKFQSDTMIRLLNQTAYYLNERARHREAEPLYRRALAIDEAANGPDHPSVAIRLNNLAMLLKTTNRLSEAEPLMRRALAIDEAAYGPDHPEVATRLNNLAQLLQATNRLSEAEPLMRRVIVILEKGMSKNHPKVAAALNNLALLLKATNRLSEAELLLRRALDIDEVACGLDHPELAIPLSNLAMLLQATNRLSEAEPLKRRAIAIFEKTFGENHPNVATALNNLATLLHATNRLSEAEPLMRRALAIDEAAYGPDHPDVATALNNLAQLLQSMNRLSEAEPLIRRALAIDKAAYGPDHPKVAIRLNNLAQLLLATNRLSEAEPLMRRSLTICRKFGKNTGHRHPHMYTAARNYFVLLRVMDLSEKTAAQKVKEVSGLSLEQLKEAFGV